MIDLEQYKNSGLTWVDAIIKELEECRLAKQELIDTLKKIEIYIAGASHTCLPINVRELDGSISIERPLSGTGKAYKLCKEVLAKYSGPSKAGSGE